MKNKQKKMAVYRASAEKRWEAEAQELTDYYNNLWIFACNASDMLKKQFGAKRVLVFGSLVNKELFHLNSDVDLAVWGMDEKKYFRAVSQLISLNPEIKTDLIMGENAQNSMLTRIENEGVEI